MFVCLKSRAQQMNRGDGEGREWGKGEGSRRRLMDRSDSEKMEQSMTRASTLLTLRFWDNHMYRGRGGGTEKPSLNCFFHSIPARNILDWGLMAISFCRVSTLVWFSNYCFFCYCCNFALQDPNQFLPLAGHAWRATFENSLHRLCG